MTNVPPDPEKDPLRGTVEPPEDKNPFYNYRHPHPRDLIAYILLIFGLILLFFIPFYGGLIIGLVAGVYFCKELCWFINHFKKFVEQYGPVRGLILAGLILAFLVSAPAIFIGAAIVVLLKMLIMNDTSNPNL